MSAHIVPLSVRCGDDFREATQDEYSEFIIKGGHSYTKWLTANRIALAKQLMQEQESYSNAWGKAFEKYPQKTSQSKPRFIFKTD